VDGVLLFRGGPVTEVPRVGERFSSRREVGEEDVEGSETGRLVGREVSDWGSAGREDVDVLDLVRESDPQSFVTVRVTL